MSKVKISDLKTNKTIIGSKILKKFVEDCRDNLNSENQYEIIPISGFKSKVSVNYKGEKIKESANEESAKKFIENHRKKYKISKYIKSLDDNDTFCYDVGGKIGISRKVLEKINSKTFKNYFDNDKVIISSIQKLVGYDNIQKTDYLDLMNPKIKIKTKLKQDFTCFVLSYFIENSNLTHYDLFDGLRQKEIKIGNKKMISISSKIDDFDVFVLHTEESYSKFFDSVATAMTIIKNKQKLGIKHPLSSYIIAEEESNMGKKLKAKAFEKIKLNEKKYYTDENKLTTSDIYLCNTSSEEFKTLLKVFNKKTLNHEQYRSSINSSYKSGDLIPISLKELRSADVGNDFTTSKIKVVNFISKPQNDDVQDNFLKKVIELLSIKEKSKFISEMNKVVDIKNESINLNPYSTRTTFNFDLILKIDDNGNPIKQDHLVFIQGNQFYIKPPGTSSDAGLGGVSMEYLKDQILMKLPDRGRFIRQIRSARVKAFGAYYQSTQDLTQSIYGSLSNMSKNELIKIIVNFNRKYPKQKIFTNLSEIKTLSKPKLIEKIENIRTFSKYKKYSLLSKAAILSPSEFKSIFESIPDNLMVDIASAYITELYSKLKKVPKIDTSLTGPFVSKTYGTMEKTIVNKLSDIEIVYFLACNHNIVKKWIKNSFIMGSYGIASGGGIILLDGKKHTLGKGKEGIIRRNPVYVKVGM